MAQQEQSVSTPTLPGVLEYADPTDPGYSREAAGKGFAYYDPDGQRVTDKLIRQRLAKLGVPPAYRDVWYCPTPHGHLQAIGVDARGRKQYIYHPEFVAHQQEQKFDRLTHFALALPRIRRRLKEDLATKALTREKVLATIVMLMETTLIRVGNERYAKDNNSYGATTLRKRHVKREGQIYVVSFKAKSGIPRTLKIENPTLRTIFRQLQDLPGQRLFAYPDEHGNPKMIYSQDVNGYLQSLSHAPISAKDFRTWNATVLCAEKLSRCKPAATVKERKHNLTTTIKKVAAHLSNTPAVCRSSYIHPLLLSTYETHGRLTLPVTSPNPRGLSAVERKVFAFLRRMPEE